MPEDNYVPMSDITPYEDANYLHTVYPQVKLALHGGELAPDCAAGGSPFSRPGRGKAGRANGAARSGISCMKMTVFRLLREGRQRVLVESSDRMMSYSESRARNIP